MADAERLVTFELLGQEYKFYTAASEEEMQKILSLVRQLVETGQNQKTGTLPASKIAVLACLNIASRYVKLRQEYDAYKMDSEARLSQLSSEIRSCLLSEKE